MGAAVPIIAAAIVPLPDVVIFVSATSLICLAALGALTARAGGASVVTGTMRAGLWGALAMAVTAIMGRCSERLLERMDSASGSRPIKERPHFIGKSARIGVED